MGFFRILLGKTRDPGMKKSIFLLIFFLFSINIYSAHGRGLEVEKKAGDYDVLIRLDKHPPIQGDNPVEIEIKDLQGKPVTDAKVLVNYYMPPMPRMAPMNYKTDAPFSRGKVQNDDEHHHVRPLDHPGPHQPRRQDLHRENQRGCAIKQLELES